MQQIGHVPPWLIAARSSPPSWRAWTLAGVVAALAPALWMWGFTVDDALIPIRYAHHVALGLGWRFNADGPSTDGVTPLPWPLLLLPSGRCDPMASLAYAKAVGLLAWTMTGAALGAAMARAHTCPPWARAAALATVALSVPVAAYAVSGMETALATALATAAVLSAKRPYAATALAGLAASLRPEMAAWACVLAAGLAIASGWPAGRAAASASLALAPFLACAVVRAVAWGRPAPLALLAKPSDIAHGLVYAEAACVVTLAPILAVAPWSLRRSPVGLAVVAAAIVHVVVLVLVGGDWMPYARLMVPVVPSLAYAGVLAAEHAAPWANGLRSVLAVGLGLGLVARGGTSGRSVGADRSALVARARPALAEAHRVAALDIGWVGASTEADIVDLAGLTDPAIAALPGGHTSKRVDGMLLLSRDPDVLLLYAISPPPEDDLERWTEAPYARAVEARLAADPVIARHFAAVAWVPIGPQARAERESGPAPGVGPQARAERESGPAPAVGAERAGYVLLAKRSPE